eukprot:358031-Chlamydomonas_euryale.AAC.3
MWLQSQTQTLLQLTEVLKPGGIPRSSWPPEIHKAFAGRQHGAGGAAEHVAGGAAEHGRRIHAHLLWTPAPVAREAELDTVTPKLGPFLVTV